MGEGEKLHRKAGGVRLPTARENLLSGTIWPVSHMPASSSAHIFFNEILNYKAGSFAFLEKLSLRKSATEENEWRDFKGAKELTADSSRISDERRKENDRKIREIWSEYLGAFANASGGVLIWGIDAPGKLAIGTSLVRDVHCLRKRLLEVTNEDVDPPVQGIDVKAIPRSSTDPEGFVICLVPPSRFAPHRSKKGEREYYIRSQDGNINCQTSVLRRLFYPLTFSYLVPQVRIWAVVGDNDGRIHLQGRIEIENRGHSSASDVFVLCSGAININLNNEDWQVSPRKPKHFWALRSIHPGQSVSLATNVTMLSTFATWDEARGSTVFSIRLFARDSIPICRSFDIPWAELRKAFDSDQKEITTEGVDLSVERLT